MRRLFAATVVALLAAAGLVGPAAPAEAATSAGYANYVFSVSASLTFPCPSTCVTTFNSSSSAVNGAGHVTSSSPAMDVSWNQFAAQIGGFASYVEQGFPLCPTLGSARGHARLFGGVSSGVAYPPPGGLFGIGNPDDVEVNVDYEYVRGGAGAGVFMLRPDLSSPGNVRVHVAAGGGDATMYFPIVGGGGTAVFEVAPDDIDDAALACLPGAPPRQIDITVTGDVNLLLGSPL